VESQIRISHANNKIDDYTLAPNVYKGRRMTSVADYTIGALGFSLDYVAAT